MLAFCGFAIGKSGAFLAPLAPKQNPSRTLLTEKETRSPLQTTFGDCSDPTANTETLGSPPLGSVLCTACIIYHRWGLNCGRVKMVGKSGQSTGGGSRDQGRTWGIALLLKSPRWLPHLWAIKHILNTGFHLGFWDKDPG